MTTAGLQQPPAAVVAGLLVEARRQLAQGRLDAGQALLRQALRMTPEHGAAHLLMAMACVQQGRADAALLHALQAVALCPDDADAHLVLGRTHKLMHRLPAAVAAYRQAVALHPGHAEALVSLGIALKHSGELAAAQQCYEQALAAKPGLAAAHANLAYVRAALAERALAPGAELVPDEAVIAQAQRAAQLAPANAVLHFNLGVLLRHARRRDEAISAFNRALGAAPGQLHYCLQLGHELAAVGNHGSAITLYERWQQGQPPAPVVMRALANLLAREGQAGAALAWAEKAAALDADPKASLQLCHSYQQCRRLAESLAAGRKAIEMSGRAWEMYSVPLMVANYLLEDPALLTAWHAEFGAALQAALPPPLLLPLLPRRTLARGQRLRVGYLSADFISHSVAFFTAPLLQHHDRQQFEVWAYHNRAHGDATTEALRASADHWVECEHLSDEALVRRLREDGIDVLVDLSGHTAGGRLRVFALGAAPLQVSYLGYPTSTGVSGMHHRISDSVIDPGLMAENPLQDTSQGTPQGTPHSGHETTLRLAHSMFCYRPPIAPPITPEPPSRRGVPTFASFNNLAKLSDRTLRLWALVLQAVPGSRLLLKAGAAGDAANQQEIKRFFASEGIAPERIHLQARLAERSDHLALYNEVDVALDSFPYNGATTTCEALWMGVPVLTRCGGTHPSRMGASILQAAGRTDWVCHSDDEFVARAAALMADAAERARWRKEARAVLTASALMDERGFVTRYEQLLLQAWRSPPPDAAGSSAKTPCA